MARIGEILIGGRVGTSTSAAVIGEAPKLVVHTDAISKLAAVGSALKISAIDVGKVASIKRLASFTSTNA